MSEDVEEGVSSPALSVVLVMNIGVLIPYEGSSVGREGTYSDVSEKVSPGDVKVGPDDGAVGSFGSAGEDEVDIRVMLPSMLVLMLIIELSLLVGEPGSLDVIEPPEVMLSIDMVGMSFMSLLVNMSIVDD